MKYHLLRSLCMIIRRIIGGIVPTITQIRMWWCTGEGLSPIMARPLVVASHTMAHPTGAAVVNLIMVHPVLVAVNRIMVHLGMMERRTVLLKLRLLFINWFVKDKSCILRIFC